MNRKNTAATDRLIEAAHGYMKDYTLITLLSEIN